MQGPFRLPNPFAPLDLLGVHTNGVSGAADTLSPVFHETNIEIKRCRQCEKDTLRPRFKSDDSGLKLDQVLRMTFAR